MSTLSDLVFAQGITTEVVGNCGMTPAPVGSDAAGLARVIGTIDVDITDVRLYGNGTTQFGIADKTIDLLQYTANTGVATRISPALSRLLP